VNERWRPVFLRRQLKKRSSTCFEEKKCIRVTWMEDFLTSKRNRSFTALAPPLGLWWEWFMEKMSLVWRTEGKSGSWMVKVVTKVERNDEPVRDRWERERERERDQIRVVGWYTVMLLVGQLHALVHKASCSRHTIQYRKPGSILHITLHTRPGSRRLLAVESLMHERDKLIRRRV